MFRSILDAFDLLVSSQPFAATDRNSMTKKVSHAVAVSSDRGKHRR